MRTVVIVTISRTNGLGQVGGTGGDILRVFPCKRATRSTKRLVDEENGKARHSRRHTRNPEVQKHGIKCV